MKALNTVTCILSKIVEVVFWIVAVSALVLMIWGIFASPQSIAAAIGDIAADPDITTAGLSISLMENSPHVKGAVIVISLMGVIVGVLVAMTFRNVYLIIKTAQGETWFSKGATPFQPDVVRMLREIGIFTIAVPVVEVVFSIILRLVAEPDFIEISVNVMHILLGLLVLWLTQAFTHGAELEDQSEGLI